MPVHVLKSCTMFVGATDMSALLQEISIDLEKDVLDATTMGNNSKVKILGLADSKIPATFLQDYDAGKTDATLFAMYNASTPAMIKAKPTSAAASATNPMYSVSCLLPQYSPIKGKIGDLATVQVTFEGTGDVTRASSS